MNSISPDLWAVSDGAWAGMVEYHDMDGVVRILEEAVLAMGIVTSTMSRT